MSSASASIPRRLHGLFNLPRASAVKAIGTDPSPPLPKKPAAASSPSPLTLDQRLQKLVKKIIKNTKWNKFRAMPHVYYAAAHRLGFHKKFSMVEDMVEALMKSVHITDEAFAVRLIMLYGKAGMFAHARKLFDELPELNCERTAKSFNALMTSCVNCKEFDQVETIFRDVPKDLSIEPNVISYNILIGAYCEMGDLDKAFLVFNDMEKNGMEPDMFTYNTLMAAFYGKGRFLDGENLWNMLESKNLAPDIMSYIVRIRGMVMEKKLEEGIGLFAEMEEKGIKPRVACFNAVIGGFCDDGNLEEAKKWYYKLKESEVTPNRFTCRALLPRLCEHGDWDMALELCKEAINYGLFIEAADVQPVVDGLVQVSKTEEAKELVELCNSSRRLNFKLESPQTST